MEKTLDKKFRQKKFRQKSVLGCNVLKNSLNAKLKVKKI